MRETRFISQNKKNWEEFESLLEARDKDPEKLSDLFVQITDDLAYARTHYPNRAIRVYLNNLARKIFSAVYIRRKTNNVLNGFITFFKEDVPALVWKARYEMLVCLVIFILSFTAGVISSRHDVDFPIYILGPEYVAMTEKNIYAGDPMAVYKQQHEATMFMGISYNNLFVSFRVYAYGILFGIGSIAMLIYNGIMVGTFQYFFVPRGVFAESFATIWLHGVPEIFAIIFSAGAGLRLARGLIFPDTYSRLQSFQNSAWESLRLMLCIIPVFLFAAFIEGFVTRYTELPLYGRLIFIALNFILIVAYFIFYPLSKTRKGSLKEIPNVKVISATSFNYRPGGIYSSADIIKGALSYTGANLKWMIRFGILAASLVTVCLYLFPATVTFARIYDEVSYLLFQKIRMIADYSIPYMFVFNSILFTCLTVLSIRRIKTHFTISNTTLDVKQVVLALVSVTALNLLFYMDVPALAFLIWSVAFPVTIIFNYFISCNTPIDEALNNAVLLPFTSIMRFLSSLFIIYVLYLIFATLINSPLFYFYQEIVSWNFDSPSMDKNGVLFSYITNLFAAYLFAPFMIAGVILMLLSLHEIRSASQLKLRINSIKGK